MPNHTPIDFQQRSKRYRTKYLESLGKLLNTKPQNLTESDLKVEGSSKPRKKNNAALTKFKAKKSKPEKIEQMLLVTWMEEQRLFFFSIPNGAKRSPWLAAQELSMGLRPGASDLFLAMPSGKYHGFFIEMKRLGQKPNPKQQEFMRVARLHGYMADWFDNWLLAKAAIEDYLVLTKPAA